MLFPAEIKLEKQSALPLLAVPALVAAGKFGAGMAGRYGLGVGARYLGGQLSRSGAGAAARGLGTRIGSSIANSGMARSFMHAGRQMMPGSGAGIWGRAKALGGAAFSFPFQNTLTNVAARGLRPATRIATRHTRRLTPGSRGRKVAKGAIGMTPSATAIGGTMATGAMIHPSLDMFNYSPFSLGMNQAARSLDPGYQPQPQQHGNWSGSTPSPTYTEPTRPRTQGYY